MPLLQKGVKHVMSKVMQSNVVTAEQSTILLSLRGFESRIVIANRTHAHARKIMPLIEMTELTELNC